MLQPLPLLLFAEATGSYLVSNLTHACFATGTGCCVELQEIVNYNNGGVQTALLVVLPVGRTPL